VRNERKIMELQKRQALKANARRDYNILRTKFKSHRSQEEEAARKILIRINTINRYALTRVLISSQLRFQLVPQLDRTTQEASLSI
jgi:hypothetical protein